MPLRSLTRTRSHVPRRGFTLLEVVIAALLVAVLMGAVYQVLFIYRKMFDRGETQTEEIQLVRTLSQQLSDDLAAAIQDPVFVGGKAYAPSGARRFGLYGNASELRIDVLQIPAFQVAPTPTAKEMEDTTQPRKLQAPELRTVYYSFYDSVPVDETLPDARVGLTRSELDFETPEELDETGLAGFAEVSLAEDMPAEEVAAGSNATTFDQLLEVGMDSSLMWAPEVVALQFRYFDGAKWRSSWDSLDRKGLPVAVEMTFGVASLEDADAIRNAAHGTVEGLENEPLREDDLVTETASLAGDEATGMQGIDPAAQGNLPPVHLHRVVVHLPNSPLQKEIEPVKVEAAPTLEVPSLAAPTALSKGVLRPARSRGGTPQVVPDKWIRNE